MKRIWIRIIFGLWVLNLFFFGIMIGRFYQPPPIAKGVYQDSSVNHDKSLPLMGKVKIFTVGLTDASKRVLNRLDCKWQALIDYTRHFSGFDLIEPIAISKNDAKVKDEVAKAPKSAGLKKELINDDQISHLEANIPFSLNSYIEEQPQNPASGRRDPFLDIVALKNVSKPQPVDTRPINNIEAPQGPNSGNTPEEKPPQVSPLSGVRLRGIVIGKSRVAYLEDQNGYQKVTVGDKFAGGKVIGITKETVVIQIGNQLITLTKEGSR